MWISSYLLIPSSLHFCPVGPFFKTQPRQQATLGHGEIPSGQGPQFPSGSEAMWSWLVLGAFLSVALPSHGLVHTFSSLWNCSGALAFFAVLYHFLPSFLVCKGHTFSPTPIPVCSLPKPRTWLSFPSLSLSCSVSLEAILPYFIMLRTGIEANWTLFFFFFLFLKFCAPV